MSKFVKEGGKYILLINKFKRKNYIDWKMVKEDEKGGYLKMNNRLGVPNELISKRVKIYLEPIEDEDEEIPKEDQPEWMRIERARAKKIHKKLEPVVKATKNYLNRIKLN